MVALECRSGSYCGRYLVGCTVTVIIVLLYQYDIDFSMGGFEKRLNETLVAEKFQSSTGSNDTGTTLFDAHSDGNVDHVSSGNDASKSNQVQDDHSDSIRSPQFDPDPGLRPGHDDDSKDSTPTLPMTYERFVNVDSRSISLYDGAFVPSHEKLYDYTTCFAMKARYNCVPPPGTVEPYGSSAPDWKYVLRKTNNKSNGNINLTMSNSNSFICDIRSIVDANGGFRGVDHNLRLKRSAAAASLSSRNDQMGNGGVTNVLFLGTSYLRQVFESLACIYRENVTDGIFMQGGPSISIADLDKRNGKPIALAEMGLPIPIYPKALMTQHNQSRPLPEKVEEDQIKFCQGGIESMRRYYHSGVKLSTNSYGGPCDDNIAMVEFSKSIRFWYVFRPEIYSKTLPRFVGQLGLKFCNVDHVIAIRKPIADLAENWIREDCEKQDLHFHVNMHLWDYVDLFRQQQLRDVGQYFGANGPWITEPPDGHPCMPGIPDDEAYVIMFLLMFGLNLR